MKPKATEQKLRGGYYTPAVIANFLAAWAIRGRADTVVEPSGGDGAIAVAARDRLVSLGASRKEIARQLTVVELDPREAALTKARLSGGRASEAPAVLARDFFGFATESWEELRVDAIVGNPPFLRFQYFPEEYREIAFALMGECGLSPNRMTNAWVPFVVASTALLSERGRLAMVLPAELLQVDYAAELREFISRVFEHVTVFTFRKLVFDGIQQEVVLLCADRGAKGGADIRVVELDDAAALDSVLVEAKAAPKPMDHSKEKWTQYFLSDRQLSVVRDVRDRVSGFELGRFASVDVGIVTGLNECFVVDGPTAKKWRLEKYGVPIVGRSSHIPGGVLRARDVERLERSGERVWLLRLPADERKSLPVEVGAYVKFGEANGWDLGYKCRIRKHWWVVPSFWIPDAFLLRQVHLFPRMVVNRGGATCTDTIHRLKVRDGVRVDALAASFVNSMSLAFSEVLGRSYGGGVLELEPREAERVPVPYLAHHEVDIGRVDALLREGDLDRTLEEADKVLMGGAMGLSKEEVVALRGVWSTLSSRRLARKQRN